MFPKVSSLSMIVLLLLLAAAAPCGAQGLIQKVDDSGSIHWGELAIRCTGVGVPLSESSAAHRFPVVIKSARANALEKLMKTLRGIPITSQMTVDEMMDADEGLRGQVVEAVKKFNDRGVHYMSDGSVEIEVELFLRGKLMDLLLPPSGGGKRITDGLLCPLCRQPWPEEEEVPADTRLVRAQDEDQEPYSGLIVDGRGLGLNPALAPKVLSEMGKTVYGVGFAQRSRSLEAGIVGYERDLELARDDQRAGPNPLVVKSLRAGGANKTDVVIDKDHTALLHSRPEHIQFMEECRVVIVLD
jgi:hypothetical protein